MDVLRVCFVVDVLAVDFVAVALGVGLLFNVLVEDVLGVGFVVFLTIGFAVDLFTISFVVITVVVDFVVDDFGGCFFVDALLCYPLGWSDSKVCLLAIFTMR